MTEPLCPRCKTTAPPFKLEDEWYCESCGCRSGGFDRLAHEKAEWSPFPSEKLRKKAAESEDPVQKMIFERLAAAMDADTGRDTGTDTRRILAEWKKRRMAELGVRGGRQAQQPEERPTEQQQKGTSVPLDKLFRSKRRRAFARGLLDLENATALQCCVWLDEHPGFLDLPLKWRKGNHDRSFEDAYKYYPLARLAIDATYGKVKKKLREEGLLPLPC